MTDIQQDTYTISIAIIQHSDLAITNVVAPTEVESGEPFDISYDVTNSGAEDSCYGHLWDNGTNNVVAGSRWEQTIANGETVTKTYTHTGITAPFSGEIQVGYVKP